MSKTVVVISETGRLIDVSGTPKESDAHYLYFAKRLLGDDGTSATLDYGWNGKTKLKIAAANGQEILLDAQDVKVSGTLKINNTPIQEIIDNSIDLELSGIQGTPGEIDIEPVANQSSDPNQPRKTYTISISTDLKNRITILENQVAGMFALDGIYYAGDGIVTKNDPVRNTINVFIGTGLKWELKEYTNYTESSDSDEDNESELEDEDEGSPEEPTILTKYAVAVDCESTIVPGSRKPVTGDAVYDAIAAIDVPDAPRYMMDIDPNTGNVILYDTLEYIESSSSSSPGE